MTPRVNPGNFALTTRAAMAAVRLLLSTARNQLAAQAVNQTRRRHHSSTFAEIDTDILLAKSNPFSVNFR